MTTLLDSNILLRLAEATSTQHPVAVAAVEKLRVSGDNLRIVPQNVCEFWAAATRPTTANGLGLSPAECRDKLGDFREMFDLLPDHIELFPKWEELVVTYQCKGRVSYDARLVAAMRTHAVTRILTFNTGDFARYPGLTVLDPIAVAAGPSPG